MEKQKRQIPFKFSKSLWQKLSELSDRERVAFIQLISMQYVGYTKILALFAGLYYALLTFLHPLFLTGANGVILSSLAAITSLFSLSVFFGVRTLRFSKYSTRWLMLAILILGVINSYAHIFLTRDHIQLTLGIMIPLVVGLLTFDRRTFIGLNTLTAIAFLLASYYVEGPYTGHFAFLYLLSLLMSYMAYAPRVRYMVTQHILMIKNRRINHRLLLRSLEAERQAELANQMSQVKSHFLANVSHELRTPLTGVAGMIELLEKDNKDPALVTNIAHARACAKLLKTLINDILDFSKLEKGKLSLQPTSVSLKGLTEGVFTMLIPAAKDKGLEFDCQIDGDDTQTLNVLTDGDRISQILYNLVGNAIKFTKVGSVRLLLTVKSRGDQVDAMWRVIDTGPGIAKQAQEKLFERFEQLLNPQDTTQAIKGAGLGLSISRELATLMGGSLGVESELGEGAEFWFKVSLPIVASVSAPKQDALGRLLARQPLRILFAEDNKVNQILITTLLNKMQADVISVDDGQQLLDRALQAADYDCIITDVRMPHLSGEEATHKIRRAGITCPIIFITANTQPEEITAYEKAGMSGYIPKPIDQDDFYQVIADVMQA